MMIGAKMIHGPYFKDMLDSWQCQGLSNMGDDTKMVQCWLTITFQQQEVGPVMNLIMKNCEKKT